MDCFEKVEGKQLFCFPFQTTSLQVLAIAGDRSSEATVTVNIEDVNDNSPIFTENVNIFLIF